MKWFVPEYDQAKIALQRLATLELVCTDDGCKIQITPMTIGDVEFCQEIVDEMNKKSSGKCGG